MWKIACLLTRFRRVKVRRSIDLALVIGHKERQPGACSKTYDLCEFRFNEELAKNISDKLSMGNKIVYREDGGSYSKLPFYINKNINPKLVVSLHCNAFNTKASGTEVLYYHRSVKGKAIAEIFQNNLLDALELPDRGIKGRGTEDRGGFVLRYTNAPCIICEPFFIDNHNDLGRAKYRYNDLVEAYVKSINDVRNKII